MNPALLQGGDHHITGEDLDHDQSLLDDEISVLQSNTGHVLLYVVDR